MLLSVERPKRGSLCSRASGGHAAMARTRAEVVAAGDGIAAYCASGGSGGFASGDSRKGSIVSIPRTLGRTGLAMVIASGEVIVSKCNSVSPTTIASPGFNSHCVTDFPFTFVPQLLPASSIVALSPSTKT